MTSRPRTLWLWIVSRIVLSAVTLAIVLVAVQHGYFKGTSFGAVPLGVWLLTVAAIHVAFKFVGR